MSIEIEKTRTEIKRIINNKFGEFEKLVLFFPFLFEVLDKEKQLLEQFGNYEYKDRETFLDQLSKILDLIRKLYLIILKDKRRLKEEQKLKLLNTFTDFINHSIPELQKNTNFSKEESEKLLEDMENSKIKIEREISETQEEIKKKEEEEIKLSAKIKLLNEKKGKVENDVEEKQKEKDKLEKEVGEWEELIKNLNMEIQTLEERKADLQDEIDIEDPVA
ncbi:MAG: hypothetical protein KDK90_27400, partial [Leptospiraceae bacterium]|nr:hypothetical protein [Leptospiraceae bacterium]